MIEPSTSKWASPVVLVPKPDGSNRFCIDYLQLNDRTVRDTYPLPRMDDCLDSLGEAKFFSTLDCNAGYWQIPVAEEDCRITCPSPRPLAVQEVVGTPGDANDLSRPGSDRLRCRCWVGS